MKQTIQIYARWIWRTYPVMTIGLMAINILVFLAIDLTVGTEDILAMLDLGASYYPLIAEEGEYWRLLTCCFLHFGVDHLFSNMLGLAALGYRLEEKLGHIPFLLTYLVTGLGANVASLIWDSYVGDWYVSAGASGCVYGIVGALLAVLVLGRGSADGIGWQQMIFAVIFMVVSSSQSVGVDHMAHLAGLILGMLLGAFLYRLAERRPQRNYWG